MADEQEPESEMVKKLRERAAKPLSRVQRRLIEPFSEEDHPLCFQHSVFCQPGFLTFIEDQWLTANLLGLP
jgi:hypothetical protein